MEKGWTGREVRYALLSVKYREPLNFTIEGLSAARNALARLDEWTRRVRELSEHAKSADKLNIPELEAFGSALDDDLNISAALAAVFDVVRETNRRIDVGEVTSEAAKGLIEWLQGVQSVLAMEPEDEEIPQEVLALVERRAQARAAKDWKLSDSLRDQIQALGWTVKDSKDGQKLTRT
jgi:cysteinyl-tRNA synthetase